MQCYCPLKGSVCYRGRLKPVLETMGMEPAACVHSSYTGPGNHICYFVPVMPQNFTGRKPTYSKGKCRSSSSCY